MIFIIKREPAPAKTDGVWKGTVRFIILPLVFLMCKYIYTVIIACDKRGVFVKNTMFIFRYFSNDVLLFVSTRVCMYI